LLASIPVLGKRIFSEETRIAIFREGSTTTLLVQTVEKLAIGFPIGDMLTERLHLFTQEDGGPIQLRTFGIAMPGRAQRPALEGMAKKHASHFIPTLHHALQSAEKGTLHGATQRGREQVTTSPASVTQQQESEPEIKAVAFNFPDGSFPRLCVVA
jgi:hypothetical protein